MSYTISGDAIFEVRRESNNPDSEYKGSKTIEKSYMHENGNWCWYIVRSPVEGYPYKTYFYICACPKGGSNYKENYGDRITGEKTIISFKRDGTEEITTEKLSYAGQTTSKDGKYADNGGLTIAR